MRSEAPKIGFEKQHAPQTSRSSMPNKYAWILLHLLSHGKIPLPSGYETQDTAITFWSGYQSLVAKKTLVGHAPIVDAKPSDMSTVRIQS